MDSVSRKDLKNAYKNRQVTGGVCCIRCSGNQRLLLQVTRDTESLRNRFVFATKIKSCPDPLLLEEWKEYGNDAFSFTVLDELKKRDEQTDKEFSEELDTLYEIWQEKAQRGDF